jgi:chloramphenicol 3-O phosphotransferase
MLIWLQGGPSTGKSSIARRMLAASETGEAWFHTGDEHVTARVPRRLIALLPPGDDPVDGWRIPVEDRTLLGRPRAGPVALRILDGMYRAAAAMAGAGVHVILDDVVWERAIADLAHRAMRDIPHVIVEVTCDSTVALEREAQRPDRYRGGVAAYASEPPLVSEPDVRLDTTRRTAGECAAELVVVVRRLQQGHRPI